MFKSKQIFTAIVFVPLSLVILITTNITKDIPLKDLKSEFKNESSRFVEVDGILVHYTDEGDSLISDNEEMIDFDASSIHPIQNMDSFMSNDDSIG